jgi:hypothetical protein
VSASLDIATAHAISASIATAAKCSAAGDIYAAEAAIERAEARLAELRKLLPSHARLVRQSADQIALARRALAAPAREENAETGELVKLRERLSHRAARASARARA